MDFDNYFDLDSKTDLCKPQVLGDWLILVVGVVQQKVGYLHVLWPHNAVGVVVASQEPLDNSV